MGVTTIYGWPWPDLPTTPPDGPAAFQNLAQAMEATYNASMAAATSYTPAWTSTGATNPSAPATITGWWSRRGRYCSIAIMLTFNAGTSGGVGSLRLGLPFVAAAELAEQYLPCETWVPTAGAFPGIAVINAGQQVVRPLFPLSAANVRVGEWRGADASVAVGTGIPTAPGAYTVQTGGEIKITGRYVTVP